VTSVSSCVWSPCVCSGFPCLVSASVREDTGILLCVDSVSEAAPVLGVNLSKIYLNKCLLLFLIKWAALLTVSYCDYYLV